MKRKFKKKKIEKRINAFLVNLIVFKRFFLKKINGKRIKKINKLKGLNPNKEKKSAKFKKKRLEM